MYCVTWSPMSDIWWRSSKVSDSFYFYLCFLWLVSLAGKMAWFFCGLVVTEHNRLWSFSCKAFLKSDTVAGLTRMLSLKWCLILVCLRNMIYEISVDLYLAPCNFIGCWRGVPLAERGNRAACKHRTTLTGRRRSCAAWVTGGGAWYVWEAAPRERERDDKQSKRWKQTLHGGWVAIQGIACNMDLLRHGYCTWFRCEV